MRNLDVYSADGDRIHTEYYFSVEGRSHEAVMVAAHDQARALFGDRPFVLRSVTMRPGVTDLMSGVSIYFADVDVQAA